MRDDEISANNLVAPVVTGGFLLRQRHCQGHIRRTGRWRQCEGGRENTRVTPVYPWSRRSDHGQGLEER